MSEFLDSCFPLTPDPKPLNECKWVPISGQCHLVTGGYRSRRIGHGLLGLFISASSSALLPASSWAICGFIHVGNISYLVWGPTNRVFIRRKSLSNCVLVRYGMKSHNFHDRTHIRRSWTVATPSLSKAQKLSSNLQTLRANINDPCIMFVFLLLTPVAQFSFSFFL